MRFVWSILLLLAALLSFGFGYASQTVWREDPVVTTALNAEELGSRGLMLLPASSLAMHEGAPTVKVSGSGVVSVATGSSYDIAAWLGDAQHASLDPAGDGVELRSQLVGDDTDDPALTSSDLWTALTSGERSVTVRPQLQDDQALLLGPANADSSVTSVSVSWPHHVSTVWVWFWYVVGGVALLAGLISYLVALRRPHRRRPGGPSGGLRRSRHATVRAGDQQDGRHGRRALSAMVAVPLVVIP